VTVDCRDVGGDKKIDGIICECSLNNLW